MNTLMEEKRSTWQIALIQGDIKLGDPTRNQAHLKNRMEIAAAGHVKPDVIVLPEMWNTGYALDKIHEIADPDGDETRRWVADFAKCHGIHVIAGSIAELRDKQVFNTMRVFSNTGLEVASYSKIHLFRLMEEEKYLAPGEEIVSFELDAVKAGASICYDIRFPELARSLSLQGAKVLFVSAEWPHPRLHHWRTLLMARAIENQMYVVACNRTGISGNDSFFGHSMIIDPWGEIIAEGGEDEEIITGTIDLSLVDEVRSRIPVFDDRRPHLYEL
ncbi:2-oxoglutaramate amidase [compost metagenome]